jgi:hypothetical protein
MSNKLPVGILGATGIVGQRFIQMLERHPWFEVAWLAASDRSEGRPYAEAARWRLKTAIPKDVAMMTVAPAKPEGAPKIIFAALDASIARELEPQFADAGCAVVSNSSALRMQADVPLVIPEVNGDHIQADRHSGLAAQVRRLCRHQPQLLGHRTGAGARSPASRVHPGNGDGGDDASGQRRGISRRAFARYSRQRHPLHRQGRREDGGGDAKVAGNAERFARRPCSLCHERAMQSRPRWKTATPSRSRFD